MKFSCWCDSCHDYKGVKEVLINTQEKLLVYLKCDHRFIFEMKRREDLEGSVYPIEGEYSTGE